MTDTATAPQQTDASPAAAHGDGLDDFGARVDAMLAESRAEEAAKPPLGIEVDAPAEAATEAPAEAVDADKAREARKARLAQLKAEERARVDARAKFAERDQLARQLAEAQERAKRLEEERAKAIDPDKLDEAAFFELAARAGVSPEKLAQFLSSQVEDPARLAAQRAQQALDPRIAAAEERVRRAEEQVQQFIAAQQQREAQAREAQLRQEFVASVKPEAAPRAAAFIGKFGQDEFLKIADAAADSLPAGASTQDLIDEIEDKLGELASVFGVQTPPAASARTPSLPNGAAKPTTVSNSLAQDRATVVDDDDFASLPIEERAKRLIAAM